MISVIIPYYNSKSTITRCLDSIRSQDLIPSEIIIINDCSEKLESDFLNSLITNEKVLNIKKIDLDVNSGAASARNAGWNIASSKYIAFLDSDDTWEKTKLSTQFEFMEKNKDCFLSSHLYSYPGLKVKNHNNKIELITLNKLIYKNYFSTPTVMIVNNNNYRFKEKQRFSEDYLLWCQIASERKCYFINKNLSKGYKPIYGHSGLSSNIFKMEFFELINYLIIYKEKRINLIQMISAINYSLLKFFRRLILTFLKKF